MQTGVKNLRHVFLIFFVRYDALLLDTRCTTQCAMNNQYFITIPKGGYSEGSLFRKEHEGRSLFQKQIFCRYHNPNPTALTFKKY